MTTRPGYIWSGTEWVSIGQEAVVAPVSYQASAPSTPSTGDIWIDSNDDVPGIDTSQFLRWRKTAVGGETSVSGTDDNGLTLQYTANYEQVYLNGVLLVRGQDYTATNGTSITGLTALAANDVVEVFGVVARVVGDVYTQAQTNSLLDAKSNVSSTGMVLISTASVTAGTSSISFNDVFSSAYKNYRVTIDNLETSVTDGIFLRVRVGGADLTSNYQYQFLQGSGSGVSASRTNGNSARIGGSGQSGDKSSIVFDIMNPQTTTWTTIISNSANVITFSGVTVELNNGLVTNNTQYTGFTLLPSTATFTTGTIKVYGYK